MVNEYITKKYKKADPCAFGGIIYEIDFNTSFRPNATSKGSLYAARIISNWNFDEICRRNTINQNEQNEIKKTKNK